MSHKEDQTGGGGDDEKFPPDLVNVNGFEGIGGIGDGGDFLPDGIEDIFNDVMNGNYFGADGPGTERHNSILQAESVLMAAEKAATLPPGEAAGWLATTNNDPATRNNSILQVENALMEADQATSLYQEAAIDGGNEDDEDKEVDEILARDMHELSVEERNQAMLDLHGIIVLTPEEPAVIAQMLLAMEQEVQRIVATDNTAPTAAAPGGTCSNSNLAYAVAESMSWDYVHDPKFRLMFIRADRYDPIKAAKRLIDFFDIKQALFGREKLCKDITLMDLFEDDETKACLEAGYCQRSRYRDAGGRPIVVNNGVKANSFSSISRQRVSFFVHIMAVMNDDDTQRRGVIWIIDDMDSNTTNSSQRVRDVLPVYFGAIHGCFPGTSKDSAGGSSSVRSSSTSSSTSSSAMSSPVATAAAAVRQQLTVKGEDSLGKDRPIVVNDGCNWREVIKTGLSKNQRVRVRKHYGAKSNIVQALATYGIPHQVTSRAHSDTIQWLQSLLAKESEFSNSSSQIMVNDGHSSSPNGTTQIIQYSAFHPEGNNSLTGGSIPSSQQLTLQRSNGIYSNSMHASTEGNREMSVDIPSQVTVRSDNKAVVAAQRYERRPSSQMPFQDTPSNMILNPSDDDVLFGRSRISVDHPGNVRFKQLVEMNLDVYYSPKSTRSTKAQIARTIVNTLTVSGGRFLRKVTNNSSNVEGQDVNSAVPGVEYWVEVDHKEAQAKCAHQFRNRRQKMQ